MTVTRSFVNKWQSARREREDENRQGEKRGQRWTTWEGRKREGRELARVGVALRQHCELFLNRD